MPADVPRQSTERARSIFVVDIIVSVHGNATVMTVMIGPVQKHLCIVHDFVVAVRAVAGLQEKRKW